MEVGNWYSRFNRTAAAEIVHMLLNDIDVKVVFSDQTTVHSAVDLCASRPDKDWGLTDCLSFVAMQREGLTMAATADRHFAQAGFTALLLED